MLARTLEEVRHTHNNTDSVSNQFALLCLRLAGSYSYLVCARYRCDRHVSGGGHDERHCDYDCDCRSSFDAVACGNMIGSTLAIKMASTIAHVVPRANVERLVVAIAVAVVLVAASDPHSKRLVAGRRRRRRPRRRSTSRTIAPRRPPLRCLGLWASGSVACESEGLHS